jgi:hypothetical protein
MTGFDEKPAEGTGLVLDSYSCNSFLSSEDRVDIGIGSNILISIKCSRIVPKNYAVCALLKEQCVK